jgi:hypothetical protein
MAAASSAIVILAMALPSVPANLVPGIPFSPFCLAELLITPKPPTRQATEDPGRPKGRFRRIGAVR